MDFFLILLLIIAFYFLIAVFHTICFGELLEQKFKVWLKD